MRVMTIQWHTSIWKGLLPPVQVHSPVCWSIADLFHSLSHTHTANTHTHHVTERERKREQEREREGEGGKRKGALLCLLLTWPLSSRHHPDHPHSPSSSLQKHNAHLRPPRSRAARLEVERQSRSRRLRWKEKKKSAGALSLTLTHSPHTLAHTHTCYRQHATKETADSCSADRQAAGGGAPAFPPLHWVLVPHWRKIHMELGFLFWLSWQARCRSHQVHLICTGASKKLQIGKITSSRISLILSPYA